MTWIHLAIEWRPVAFRVALLGVAVYAWRRGGAPERYAAAMFCGALIASWWVRSPAAYWLVRIEPAYVMIDLLLLGGLVTLALRADRRWPIWCVSWQVLASLGHLTKVLIPDLYLPAYQIMLSLSSWPTVFLLARGVHRHQQRLARQGIDPDWSWVSRYGASTRD